MTLGNKLFEAKYGAPIFPVQIQGPNLPGPDLPMAQFGAPVELPGPNLPQHQKVRGPIYRQIGEGSNLSGPNLQKMAH